MTMKKQKTLQHIAAVAVVLLTLCLVFAVPVSAGGVASVTNSDGTTDHDTLQEALQALQNGGTLTLLQSVTITEDWDCRNYGANADYGMFTVPVTIEGNDNTITFTGKISDNNWNAVFRFEADATVKNLTIDVSEATDVQRGISTKLSITVDNCKFIGNGDSCKRAIIFGEGAGASISNVEASITKSEFKDWSYGVSDNQNAQDAKSVTITGNKFNSASVLVSAKETVTFTGNEMKGGDVIITSYSATPSLKVTATGNTLDGNKINSIGNNAKSGIISINADEGFTISLNAQVGGTYYKTLQAALNAAEDDAIIQLLPGTISEGTIKMPAVLKNVVIKGAENKASVLKDTKLMAHDGNTLSYEDIIIDGIVFDNSNIVMTGNRNGDVIYHGLTIQNCEFKNIYRTGNEAAIHINTNVDEALKNFTFVNNVIDGVSGSSNSGLYLKYLTGTIKFENNVVNNVAFIPCNFMIVTNDDVVDILTVTGNTFSGTSGGNVQALCNVADGADDVDLKINDNIFKDITDSYQICYYNFNAEKTTIDFSGNYYDIDLFADPGKIYYNSACASVDDLIAATVFPYYNKLTEDGKIDTTSIVEPTYTIKATDVGFDSVKVGYAQPDAKDVKVINNGNVAVTLVKPTNYDNYEIVGDFPTTVINPGESVTFKIQPKAGLAVGNYGTTLEVTNTDNEKATFKVSFLVYQPSSGGSSKPVEEPEEPVVEPETPTEEPEAGEATVETEVTDGGEVELETPAAGGSAAADEDETKITGVVLPTGTEGKVEFVPVSEQAAPEGKETQTKKVFEINVPTYEKGKPATIKFTMTVAELAADGKEAADVALWHFDEETGEWTKLVTSYTIVDGIVYFEAITNDFSPFAIVYEDEPVNEPVEEPETPASPAPVLGLIAALGAAVALRRK